MRKPASTIGGSNFTFVSAAYEWLWLWTPEYWSECFPIRSKWTRWAACFMSWLFSLHYLLNICCSFQIFLKTSMIQSHSAADSLIVWLLQNSSTQEARFVQSRLCQVVFSRDVCQRGTANKKLIFFSFNPGTGIWFLSDFQLFFNLTAIFLAPTTYHPFWPGLLQSFPILLLKVSC